MSDELSKEDIDMLSKFLSESGAAPSPEEKYNVHVFLHRVATSPNTVKVANLSVEELGMPKYPVRSILEFALIAEDIIGNKFIADHFKKQAEITNSTSLSKEGFLVKQATTTTRQIADVSKPKKVNRGWFGRRKEEKEEQQ